MFILIFLNLINGLFFCTLRATLDRYSSELMGISASLLRCMATNLEVDPDKLVSMFEDGTQGIRMNYYPPCPQASRVMGLTPHSDATGLTLLIQVNEVDGLQIKKNGKWLPIKPLPGAFIVNIGDAIEVIMLIESKCFLGDISAPWSVSIEGTGSRV